MDHSQAYRFRYQVKRLRLINVSILGTVYIGRVDKIIRYLLIITLSRKFDVNPMVRWIGGRNLSQSLYLCAIVVLRYREMKRFAERSSIFAKKGKNRPLQIRVAQFLIYPLVYVNCSTDSNLPSGYLRLAGCVLTESSLIILIPITNLLTITVVHCMKKYGTHIQNFYYYIRSWNIWKKKFFKRWYNNKIIIKKEFHKSFRFTTNFLHWLMKLCLG